MFGGDLFNLLIEDTPGRIKLLVSNTSLILRGLDFSMCPFDNEVSVIRAFNFRVVLPNSSLQFIDSISQLEYFVLIIIVLYDESITVQPQHSELTLHVFCSSESYSATCRIFSGSSFCSFPGFI